MRRLTGRKRLVVLVVSALLCAVASALVASGSSLTLLLASPWSRQLVLAFTLGGWLLGLAASRLLLWEVNLAKAIPLVSVVTVLVASVTPFMSAIWGLMAGVLAMLWCCGHSPWQLQPPRSPVSVFREGLKGLASDPSRSNGAAS